MLKGKSNDHPPRGGNPPRRRDWIRGGALTVVVLITGAATAAAVSESYNGLRDWAGRHAETGSWGVIWPLLIDAPLIGGEVMLLVAFKDRWPKRRKIVPWALVLLGLAASIEANFWRLRTASVPTRMTSAAAPVVACIMLAATLLVLKWVADDAKARRDAAAVPAAVPRRRPARRAAAVPRAGDDEVIARLRELLASGHPPPAVRAIARDELGNVNAHRRAKALLAAAQNGHDGG